jgi:hypothetical protein
MSKSVPARRIGRPPGADGDKTEAALLDAALRAFAERGFEGFASRLGFTSPKPGQPLDDHVEALIDMIVAGMSRSSD